MFGEMKRLIRAVPAVLPAVLPGVALVSPRCGSGVNHGKSGDVDAVTGRDGDFSLPLALSSEPWSPIQHGGDK